MRSIERTQRFLNEGRFSLNTVELECRLEILKKHFENALLIQNQFEAKDGDDVYREELEETAIIPKSLLNSIFAKARRKSVDNSATPATRTPQCRLPSVALPTFSGKHSEFKNLISLFETFVIHLTWCLAGRAFQVTADNYPKALASLRRVYASDCSLFFDNISTLFNLPTISKPSAITFRNLIDTVTGLYDSLLSTGDHKRITNAILIHLTIY